MLNDSDIKLIRTIVKEEVKDAVQKEIQPLEITMDKVLKIVTSDRDEHVITKAKVTHHEKRLKKIETKLKIKPASPILF
ncbi:MAG: hypothetical protein WCG44_02880 [bacterium]